jgi:hypothetical protein
MKSEDGLNKGPKHVACLAYCIIAKFHTGVVLTATYGTYICVLPSATEESFAVGGVAKEYPILVTGGE